MDETIADLKAQIEEQKILFPLYQKVREGLTREALEARSAPQKCGLPARRMDDLSAIFGGIAANSGLDSWTVVPDVRSLTDDSHFLSVDLTLKGDLFKLHEFLLQLADLSCLENIQELQIVEGSEGKEYFLKVWLMIDNAQPAAG